jgi:hypothetical protein
MAMNLGKMLPLVMVVILVLAARFAVNVPQTDQKAEAAKMEQWDAQEKARRLAGACSYQVSEEDFLVSFPDQPRQDQYIFIGSNDDDWHLHWSYDTSFYVERTTIEDEQLDLAKDRAVLQDAARRMVDDCNQFRRGKPDAWVLTAERDLTVMDQFAAREFTYSYRKYTTELPRTGRVRKVKVPGAIITLQVDGEPEVVDSPLVESFLESLVYVATLK